MLLILFVRRNIFLYDYKHTLAISSHLLFNDVFNSNTLNVLQYMKSCLSFLFFLLLSTFACVRSNTMAIGFDIFNRFSYISFVWLCVTNQRNKNVQTTHPYHLKQTPFQLRPLKASATQCSTLFVYVHETVLNVYVEGSRSAISIQPTSLLVVQ